MAQNSDNFKGLFGFICRFPRTILAVAVVLSLVSGLYTVRNMEFLTGRDDLMPKNSPFHRDYREYRQEFGDREEIVVVIEGNDRQRVGEFADRLHALLSADQKHFGEVFHPFGLPFFKKNGLLFMPLSDLKTLKSNLIMLKPLLRDLAAAPSVQTLFSHLTHRIELCSGSAKACDAERLAPLLFTLDKLGSGLERFGSGNAEGISLEEFFFRGKEGETSTFARAGKTQIITLVPAKDPSSFTPAEESVRIIRETIERLRREPRFQGVTVGLTGTPVLEYEEMATSQRDISIATILSLILTIVLLLFSFRGVVNVMAAMVTLIVAICLSFGFATATIGHLNILSMVFAIMLIGIGIEYGIQLVLRYQEELRRGEPELEAIRTGLDRNLWPITMAAATVAVAFLTFVFTDFKGISELGIIAGGGIFICVVTTFTVLPAMLVLISRHRGKPAAARPSGPPDGQPERFGRMKQFLFGHPRRVVLITLLLALISLYPASRVRFDYNLLNLQAKGLESVTYARKLMRDAENAGYTAVATAGSAAEAAALAGKLEQLPSVDHVVTLASFVPEDQDEKLAELAVLKRELDEVRPNPYEEELRLMELPAVFENFRTAVENLKDRLAREGRKEAEPAGRFLATLDRFFTSLEKERDTRAVGMLRDFQGGMLAELPARIAELKQSLPDSRVTLSDIPEELRSRFVGVTGKYLLQIAPKGEIFDREPLARYISDVRRVAPRATGEPVMVYESMTIMRDSYLTAFLYAFAAIVVILLATFRSVLYAAIGLVPLVAGLLLMIDGMWLFGIDFNSANIIVMPLLLGIAVDSGIYIINRYRMENESGVEVVTSSTGRGVVLNTLMIMASFGALMVAHHQGVFSIGAVMSLGMLACQVAFILVLPAALSLSGKR